MSITAQGENLLLRGAIELHHIKLLDDTRNDLIVVLDELQLAF